MIIFSILSVLCLLGFIACWIMTVIKMFKKENIGLSILGCICWIWTFIWGWMNAEKLNHKKIMLIWTALLILGTICNLIGGGFSYSASVGR